MMGRALALMLLGVLAGTASPIAAARIPVIASKSDVLYAPGSDIDCSTLSKQSDDQLPFYIVRLRADAPAGIDPAQLRFEWQLPKPDKGAFAADEDLGPDGQSSVVRTLCAEVGNECTLTEEQLAVYNRPTILWVAPTCGELPDDTTKPFRGGTVRIGVRVFQGKRRVGKGTATVGYGRIATATLLVSDLPDSDKPKERQFRDGHGKPTGEPTHLFPTFGARASVPGNLPAIQSFEFDSGGGGTVQRSPGCPYGLDSCTLPGQIAYTSGGKHVAQLSVELQDGSLLCDRLTVRVLTAPLSFTIDVSTTPARRKFARREGVNLRVRLRNTSPPSDVPNILFTGNVLSCETEVRIGSSTLMKTTQIDLQHCSTTIHQPCENDGDCQPSSCQECTGSETCITASHCGSLPLQGCLTDRDCRPPRCPECTSGDTCVQVLPVSAINLGRNDAFDVVDSSVLVDNLLPAPAAVKDTWTAHSYNAGDESTTFKYSITPR